MNQKSNAVFVHFGCGHNQALSSAETLLEASTGLLIDLKGEVAERINATVEMLEADTGSEAVLSSTEVNQLRCQVQHLRTIESALALILKNPLVVNATKSHLPARPAGPGDEPGPCSRRARAELADMMGVIARLQRGQHPAV